MHKIPARLGQKYHRRCRLLPWGLVFWGAWTWTAAGVRAGDNRFRFAACEQWSAKRGFYLALENKTPGTAVCTLKSLRLILGIGDGRTWRFLTFQPKWRFNRDYRVRAVIRPDRAELWLDGAKVGESRGGYVGGDRLIHAAQVPAWAAGPANYMVIQRTLELRGLGGGRVRRIVFPDRTVLPPGLLLFQPQTEARVSWPEGAAPEGLEVRATFRMLPRPSLRKLAPFVDKFGQCRYARWPGKVHEESALREDIVREDQRLAAMPPPSDFDGFGGWKKAPWRERGTGYFRVIRRRGVWWLIAPTGFPCFYLGVDSIPSSTWPRTPVSGREFLFESLPPRSGVWAKAWSRNSWGRADGAYVCFQAANLIRKYGPESWLDRAAAQGVRRIRCWGFSGGGKWGTPQGLVSTPVLHLPGVPRLARHPDVFDPAVRKKIRVSLAAQIRPRIRDPYVLGWSIGNEYDEIISTQEIRDILGQVKPSAGRRALLDYARRELYHGDTRAMAIAWGMNLANSAAFYAAPCRPPAGDVEKLRRFYEDRYYSVLYDTVKSIDPNHLYLGCWVAFRWWENEEDWLLCGRHVDVIGYDRYTLEFADPEFYRLVRASDKPVLWGEFSVPPDYGGRRGFGQYSAAVETEAAAGEAYARLIRAAAGFPYCIGAMWFEYRDQPVTGRGPGHGPRLVFGEHYAFGLVTVTDRVKWPLVRRMRAANLKAVLWRERLTEGKKGSD